ncbi:MAG: arsB [Clostridia bacterium]|nr:arsB [Clostridia bacterium]
MPRDVLVTKGDFRMCDTKDFKKKDNEALGFFAKYLTVWVAICIVAGVVLGQVLPIVPETLSRFEYAKVSIPVAILIWLMIYPMMLKIDFSSVVNATKKPKGLIVTCATNWLIKPFTMYFIAAFFFYVVFKALIPADLAKNYLAGAVLLGAAPCTAMVFVWSHLTKGDPAYTLVQVAVNDIILLVAFTPIVAFLLGVSDVIVPYDTLFLSVILFVVIPLAGGYLSRRFVIKNKGQAYFDNVFIKKFDNITVIGLLLTLIIIFSFQGEIIINNPLHIALIAVPLTLQTFLIFFLSYGWAKIWKLKHEIAAPAGMIGASNFFELAVAVAISLFGLDSGAALATVVGVLVEVPVMLLLVKIANNTKHWFQNNEV